MALVGRIAAGVTRVIVVALGLLCCLIAIYSNFLFVVQLGVWLFIVMGAIAFISFFRRTGHRDI